MGELEKFVSRWSRRKRTADLKSDPRERAAPSAVAVPRYSGDEAAARQDSGADTFDPAALPSLDSITAATDIRAFLQSAVPVELARAALRRAWVTDPLIRDFVGIAENQWDFNNPTTIPGFGPLSQVADAADRVVQVMRPLDCSLSRLASAHSVSPGRAENSVPTSDPQNDVGGGTDPKARIRPPAVDEEVCAAAPASISSEETAAHKPLRETMATARVRRAHGGALPR